ncbi:MAG: hypothetical protein LBL34_04450, partial [Clostridiales bacterium]|nr:hypothetical protein [Clostridiales bacterium]
MLKKLLAIIIIFTFTLGGLLFPSVSLEGVELFNSTTAQAAHELQGKYFTMTWNQPVYDSSFNTALLYTGEKTTIGNFNAYWTNCSSGAVLPENGTGFEVLMVGWQIGISSSGNGVLNGSYSATLYRGVTDRGWSYVYSTATTAAGVAASNSYWWQWTIGDPTLDYISGREYPANYEIKWGSGTFTNPYVLQQLTAVTPEPSPTVGTPGNISYSSLQWGSTLTAPSNPTGGTRTRWEYAT